jgi:hypothetical protein
MIEQQHMIAQSIEPVALEPARVIDHRPIAAQFLDKHTVSQPLRRQQISLTPRQPHLELRLCHLPCAPGLSVVPNGPHCESSRHFSVKQQCRSILGNAAMARKQAAFRRNDSG